jgi:hypothetical protein
MAHSPQIVYNWFVGKGRDERLAARLYLQVFEAQFVRGLEAFILENAVIDRLVLMIVLLGDRRLISFGNSLV